MASAGSALPSRLHGLPPVAVNQILSVANALEARDQAMAQAPLRELVRLHPAHPEVLRLLGGWRVLRGEFDDALIALRRAIELRPGDALYHNTLGTALAEAGRFDDAAGEFATSVRLLPGFAQGWYNLALIHRRYAEHDEAVAALTRTLALQPEHVHARTMLAESLKAEGRNDAAIAEFRAILARHPHAGLAWWGLAEMHAAELRESDAAALRVELGASTAGVDDRVAMGFALARILERQGDLAAEMETLARANELARSRTHWDAAAFSRMADSALATPTENERAIDPALGADAIFIVSLPRSGSTLVEQILASHAQVGGGAELGDLPQVLAAESRRRGGAFPLWMADASAHDWHRLGVAYLQRCAHWRAGGKRCIDKLPDNWLNVGAIRAMLPAAHIVFVRRDPLETCLGCYRQLLVNHEYTRTFADLAHYWRQFDRAAVHWLGSSARHVHESVHEALLADPETQIRRLLDACDLAFDPACLDFHRNPRRVLTPSAQQVREPLRATTARAARYGRLLDPLRLALGQAPMRA